MSTMEKPDPEYYEGKGCECLAAGQCECACDDVDWTDAEIYELRYQVSELESACNQILECTRGSKNWNGETEKALKAIENALGVSA